MTIYWHAGCDGRHRRDNSAFFSKCPDFACRLDAGAPLDLPLINYPLNLHSLYKTSRTYSMTLDVPGPMSCRYLTEYAPKSTELKSGFLAEVLGQLVARYGSFLLLKDPTSLLGDRLTYSL